jgi:alpha amylase-like protein
MTPTSEGAAAASVQHPLLYQINTRVLLGELGRALGRPATLDDLPDALLDEVAERGFHWLWPLGVWRTGDAAVAVSRREPSVRAAAREELPDFTEADITGSPFAIRAYEAREEWGGADALARLRARARARGMRLLLDFVPNHVAPDHRWVDEHPEYLIAGTADDAERRPLEYTRIGPAEAGRVFALGRDPYFPGWPDTLQLNYGHAGLHRAMLAELANVAAQCDGVRCDMAMLLLPDVFERTWGQRRAPADGSAPAAGSFWAEAIGATRRQQPGFTFVAEAYWDLEWRLQAEGFDFTYDKRLYDRLRAGPAAAVRDHLLADADYQRRSVRFLENHDEARAAAVFALGRHRAAAVIAYLVPGLRLFHEGQLEGRTSHVSMHLGRRRQEAPVAEIAAFYFALLAVLRREEPHAGDFMLHGCRPAWEGNPSFRELVVFSWAHAGAKLLAAVNLAGAASQCYVDLAWPEWTDQAVVLADMLSEARYERRGRELLDRGLYLDMPPWGYHVFECRARH